MPLTPAERQKRYRERLKRENPEKYILQKNKNAERTKKNRKRISECSLSEQQHIRKQWRERKNKSKDKREVEKPKCLKVRRVIYKLKKENKELKLQHENWKRTSINLRKKLKRSKNKINELSNLIKQKDEYIQEKLKSSAPTSKENIENMTPLSKTYAYVEENLPNIRPEEKERVKKTLLQHNVLVEAIKQGYLTRDTQGKRLVKEIFKNSDTLKKYNMRTKMATYLGLKGKIRHTLKKNRSHILLNQLKEFYERDDVSRMTAGKNETKTQKKQKKQRRYLLGTLRKLHQKYVLEGGKLSFSTFKRYRPFYVLPPKAEKRDTCACKRHENLLMKATVLKSIGVLATKDLDDLVAMVVCDVKSKKCAYSECEMCTNKHIDFVMGENDMNDRISWNEWVLNTHEYKPKKNNDETKTTKRVDKENKTGSLKSLIDGFQKELEDFKVHSYNIIHQYKEYCQCTKNLDNHTVALHIDFSENYACKLAKEIQAMHFDGSRHQITIHTGILYSEKGKQSFASMSPNKDHGPDAIWAHLLPVLKMIKEKFPEVDGIHFCSDGPTVQYRQKKNFYYFSKLTRELGFPYSTWNFFESAHGKGAADGVGGAIKRNLDAFVAYGTDVPDAKTAFNLLQQSDTKIQLFYIPEEAIVTECIDLVPVPKTMKLHQIINNVNMENAIFYRDLSCFCEKGLPRRGFCDCLDLKPAILTKETPKKKENATKPINTVTKLSDVKNTAENKAYFDLSQYRHFNIKETDQKINLDLKHTTRQTVSRYEATASTSKGKGVGKKNNVLQTENKKKERDSQDAHKTNKSYLELGKKLQEGKRKNIPQKGKENFNGSDSEIRSKGCKRRKTDENDKDSEDDEPLKEIFQEKYSTESEKLKHQKLNKEEKNMLMELQKYDNDTLHTTLQSVGIDNAANTQQAESKICTDMKLLPAICDVKNETTVIEYIIKEDTYFIDKTMETINVDNMEIDKMPIFFTDDPFALCEEVELSASMCDNVSQSAEKICATVNQVHIGEIKVTPSTSVINTEITPMPETKKKKIEILSNERVYFPENVILPKKSNKNKPPKKNYYKNDKEILKILED